jgi:hypothetical protein
MANFSLIESDDFDILPCLKELRSAEGENGTMLEVLFDQVDLLMRLFEDDKPCFSSRT